MAIAVLSDQLESPVGAGTVFIVDDDPDMRASLSLLARSVDLDAASFASAQEFLNIYDGGPGCLVLDVRMPAMSGLELQKQLAAQASSLSIILITAHAEVPMAIEAMRGGAFDFIQKPFSRHAMLDRIHQGLQAVGDKHRARSVRQQVEERAARLSQRECEVARRLAAGDSSKVIAARLGISSKTVDNHRIKVFQKMGVDNAAQLASLLHQINLQSL
jgi:two-component system response regulator FixJ